MQQKTSCKPSPYAKMIIGWGYSMGFKVVFGSKNEQLISKNDKIEMSIIEVEPQLTVKNKLMKINHQELEYKMSDEDIKKLIEENNEYMNKCMELEESISQMKLRIVDNSF